MSIGRRKVRLQDEASWVFNRMVAPYEARPPYPSALVDAIAELVEPAAARVLDVGAGLGHLALPLAARGHAVTAVEPAIQMLKRLSELAAPRLECVHAMAEDLPFAAGSFDHVVVADVVHFLDSERAAREIARVLAKRGSLAVVVVELADTPFMRAARELMEASAPRRPRDVSNAVTELLAVAGVGRVAPRVFHDETPVDRQTLERIFRSVSFIGPAMNEARWQRFSQRLADIEHPRVWARSFTLWGGRR